MLPASGSHSRLRRSSHSEGSRDEVASGSLIYHAASSERIIPYRSLSSSGLSVSSPTTTRLRALDGGVDSSADQRGRNAQKTQEEGQAVQMQQIFLDGSVRKNSPVNFFLTARGEIKDQGELGMGYYDDATSVGACPTVFCPPTSIILGALKFQRELDMGHQERRSTVFLPPTFIEPECEHSPAASAHLALIKRPEDYQASLIAGSPMRRTVEGLVDQYLQRKAKIQVRAPCFLTSEPLVGRIRSALFPLGWSTPAFPRFEGEGDPDLHLMEYRTLMAPNDSEDQLARMFKQSLKGQALQWHYRLGSSSVDSFETLAQEFVSRYSFNRAQPKHLDSLFDIEMGRTEMLKAFVIRFRSEIVEIEGVAQNEELVCRAFGRALIEGHPLKADLLCWPARSLCELYKLADRRIRVEKDASRSKKAVAVAGSDAQRINLPWRDKASAACSKFRANYEEIFEAIKYEPFFRFPKLVGVKRGRSDSRYCSYYGIEGHLIKECHNFKVLLSELVSEGRLREFM